LVYAVLRRRLCVVYTVGCTIEIERLKSIRSIEPFGKIGSDMSRRPQFSIREKRRLKFAPGARIVGRQRGPTEYRSRMGIVIEYLGASLYRVKFDDKEQKECVLSQWLELNEKFPW
jgi:hypothetical protein